MIVMTPEATEAQIADVKERLASIERLHVLVLPGELTTAIGAIGDPEGVAELGLEGMPGVDRVVPISRPYKLASSEFGDRTATTLHIDGRTVGGGGTFCLIAHTSGSALTTSSQTHTTRQCRYSPATQRFGSSRRVVERRP